MSIKPRTKNELSSDEANSYWAAFFIVSDALSLCREKLLSQESNTDDAATQNTYRAARMNLEVHLESMQAMRYRFNDGRSKVSPPSTEQIRSLAMASAKVTGFAGDSARMPEVVEVTTEIFNQFQSLQEL